MFGKIIKTPTCGTGCMATIISYEQFRAVDIRIGTIIEAEEFPQAKKPAYKLIIDLGELGKKRSSAQVTGVYKKEDLVGKQVVCVVNFGEKQIGPFVSEVLTTGFDGPNGVILASVDKPVKNGLRLY